MKIENRREIAPSLPFSAYSGYCDMLSSGCTPIPISLGSSKDQTYLVLFGTGIRGAGATSAVTAMVGPGRIGHGERGDHDGRPNRQHG